MRPPLHTVDAVLAVVNLTFLNDIVLEGMTMNLAKLNPWNWFKHENNEANEAAQIPLTRNESASSQSNLSTLNHADPLSRLHQQMDQLFDDVWNAAGVPMQLRMPRHSALQNLTSGGSHYLPQLDISGDEKNYEVTLDVPGLSESDINIEVSGDVLTITGKKEEKNEVEDKQFYRIERSYGSFKRTLSLPDDVNVDEVSASLKDGILTLSMPRSAQQKKDARRISISS